MKKVITPLLCLLLSLALISVVFASQLKIVDYADILTEYEESLLEGKADQIVQEYQMDVVILTVQSLDGQDITSYADDYYDYNGYGIGDDYSGVLMMLSMEEREWAISTCGDGIYALTDYGIQELFDSIADDLAADQYYDAFDKYLNELSYYFDAYHRGSPVDGYRDPYEGPGTVVIAPGDEIIYYPEREPDYFQRFLIALLIGCIAGGVTLLVMRGQMNTAVAQSGARNYLNPGSYNLKRHQDIFLYSRVSRQRKPDQNHSGGRGGGSSVHRGSSGRSHGGGRGRF